MASFKRCLITIYPLDEQTPTHLRSITVQPLRPGLGTCLHLASPSLSPNPTAMPFPPETLPVPRSPPLTEKTCFSVTPWDPGPRLITQTPLDLGLNWLLSRSRRHWTFLKSKIGLANFEFLTFLWENKETFNWRTVIFKFSSMLAHLATVVAISGYFWK